VTGRQRWITAVILLVVGTAAPLITQRDHGVVRDEVVYMNAGTAYARWWGDLFRGKGAATTEQITAHFGGKQVTDHNSEHPPLMKTLFGISEAVVSRFGGGQQHKVTAYRIPTALFFGLLLVMVFLFGASVWGWTEGVLAALLLLLMPRLLFHAGLATFDAPMVTVWTAALFAYYKSLERPWLWGALFGVAFGLALATKHNAVILPAAILVHWSWVLVRETRSRRAADTERGLGTALWRALLRRGPLTVPAMVVIGPLVLVALWPWLWFDTAHHVSRWIGFHLHHVDYNFEYLGQNWNHPPFPWHVAIVTTLFTVPTVTLVAGAIGAVQLIARARAGIASQPERAPALLLFLSAGVAMGPFLLRTTPIFGASKHWLPAMPTITLYAGVGLVVAVRLAVDRLARVGLLKRVERARPIAIAAVAVLVCTASAFETVDAQPYALTHYTALAGGAPGGADLGMNRQFWGYSAVGVLPFLDRVAAHSDEPLPVYSHDASMAWGVWMREGLLSRKLPDAGHEESGVRRSKLAIVIHELHFNRHDYMIWRDYGTVQPVYVLTTDGVPIVSVYARRGVISSTATRHPR